MSATGIGRLLTASLHQAITELLPARVPFYEPWLSTDGFRTSRASLAGIRAAFSFLRREPDAYDGVMRLAGETAANWIWRDLSGVRRAWLRALPVWARRRAAGRLVRRLAAATWRRTRTTVRWRRGEGSITIEPSIFCDVRELVGDSLCQYYAAGLARFLRHLSVDVDVEVRSCRARDGEPCMLVVPVSSPSPVTITTAAILAVIVAVAGARAGAQDPATLPAVRDRVLVVPFDNVGHDPRLTWLAEGAALLLTDELRAQGTDAMTRDERLRVFDRLQVPPLATLSRASVIRIGNLVGASDVITGDVQLDGETFVIRTRRIRLDPGILEPDLVERAGAADLMLAFGRLARQLGRAATVAGPGSDDARVTGPPFAAFEAYVKGLLADSPDRQAAFLATAIQAYPAYDAARLALWQVRTTAGRHGAAADIARGVPESSPRAPDARFLLSLSLMHQGLVEGAVEVLVALRDRFPSPAVLNNIGVATLREPALASRVGHPAWSFNQARTMDRLDPDYVFNLGYAYWIDDDAEGANYWLRECVRLDPTDAAAHALLARTLHASGHPAEAGRELVLAKRLSSSFDAVELKSGTPAPRGLERMKEVRDPQPGRADAVFEMVGQRDQMALARFYLDRGRRLVERELDRDAEAELTRALYLAPYDPEAHLLLGRIYLRAGRLRQAIDAVKISLWSAETAAGHLVLAEAYLEGRDEATARTEAQRALVLDPDSIHARQLLDRLPK